MTTFAELSQKLIFVLGKGGVGRTSVSAALAWRFALSGEKVLVVQWALQDAIGPRFGLQPCQHRAVPLRPQLFLMNFSSDEAIREYFVDHLGMRVLYKLVVENRHVQRLIQAAPGIQELFFLGRLFWLVELAAQERGVSYDRIIVDAPATGHGFSLFSVAPTVASFGVAGPLAKECHRVAKLLADPAKCALLCVTLPEELPIEETLEFLPKLRGFMPRNPLSVCLNRSVAHAFGRQGAAGFMKRPTVAPFLNALETDGARASCELVASSLEKREGLEKRFLQKLDEIASPLNLGATACFRDQSLFSQGATDADVIVSLSNEMTSSWIKGWAHSGVVL